MADQLATPQDLASLLDLRWDDLPPASRERLTLMVEVATAVVQSAAGGQRIVADTSTAILPAPAGRHLDLPQWPVRKVVSVSIDGAAPDSLWKPDGARVWRSTWRPHRSYPVEVAVTYEHGYPDGSQGLQLARKAVLGLAAPAARNPQGLTRRQIDDYAETYDVISTRLEASRFLKEALVAQYGRPAAGVRIGG